jgi:hypothetical protein
MINTEGTEVLYGCSSVSTVSSVVERFGRR